jgi:hypothetical protein
MPLESPTVRDGDAGFVGFASRLNPVALPAGMLQSSENMRLDRGTAKTRKGARRLADDLLPGDFPVTLPFRFDPIETSETVLDFTLATGTNGVQLLSAYPNGVFASGAYRSPGLNNKEYILLATATGAFVYDDTNSLGEATSLITDHTGDPITDQIGDELEAVNYLQPLPFPEGEIIEPTDKVSMVQAFDRTYLLREADQNVAGWGPKELTGGGIGVSGTTATVYCTAHGYSAGQRVRLDGGSVAAFAGHEYDIVGVSTSSFTITVPSGTASMAAAAGRTVRRVKPPMYWTGDILTGFAKAPGGVPAEGPTYRKMRSVGWATYANGRLVLPDDRDQVMLSDILSPDLYDPFWASFRANQGSNDYIVAVHPWVEGSFLVFMRNSIWLATVNQFASTDGGSFAVDSPVSKLELLTDEIGCSARRSIATAGQYIYFLSDAGVYRLDARLDLKLRGDTKPLSDAIADQIARIPSDGAENAVGLWHDNRYWLAAPVDGADLNNALFIYSALNEQWETIDSYPFGISNLIVAQRNATSRRLFAASLTGKLFLLEDVERGDDPPDSTLGIDYFTPVGGRLKTRRYGFGTMGSKRFVRVMSDVVLPNTGSIKVNALMVNPDKEIELVPGMTNTSGLAEDYTLKQPIRTKAHYCEIEFETTAERPEIRTVGVEAAMPSMPQTETRHSE